MNKPNNHVLPYAVSFIVGLAICLYITETSGRREAWDAPEYFTIGIPEMCLVIFALAYCFPQRTWRWALSMAIGQSVAMVLGGRVGGTVAAGRHHNDGGVAAAVHCGDDRQRHREKRRHLTSRGSDRL